MTNCEDSYLIFGDFALKAFDNSFVEIGFSNFEKSCNA